jgi:hypothetical protein
VENYFNYFTEVEERYLQRRGGGLLLSTFDWALIETWKDAGIPLEAVLRGIDSAFDKYDQRPKKTKKINSLAYCSQAVLSEAEDMKEAAVGSGASAARSRETLDAATVVDFLRKNAAALAAAKLPPGPVLSMAGQESKSLRQLADEVRKETRLEDVERRLTVLEEKLFAALLTSTADDELVAIRAQAERDLAPYRNKMSGPQIEQLQKQYVHKRLLEKYRLPRLSLFYM